MTTFFKGISALVYSLIHAWLINLVAIGILFLAIQIFSLSWFWIIVIFLFMWSLIEMFRDFILGLIALPYAWLTKTCFKALILPMVYLVINAIWFAYSIWSNNDLDGTIGIVACLFATYEILVLTYKSILAMLAMSSES